jgi:hypothetical protein
MFENHQRIDDSTLESQLYNGIRAPLPVIAWRKVLSD